MPPRTLATLVADDAIGKNLIPFRHLNGSPRSATATALNPELDKREASAHGRPQRHGEHGGPAPALCTVARTKV
ncbi:MAG TPA: hypothetical protein VF306_01540 [Pirellulales bacterium]